MFLIPEVLIDGTEHTVALAFATAPACKHNKMTISG